MMFDAVTQLNGQLQIIAFDHADFADEWFHESIIETWRDGVALIPREWYMTEQVTQPVLPASTEAPPSEEEA